MDSHGQDRILNGQKIIGLAGGQPNAKAGSDAGSNASASSFLSRGVEALDDSVYDPRLAGDPSYLFLNKRLIHPDSTQKLAWDIIIYILSIYSVSRLMCCRVPQYVIFY